MAKAKAATTARKGPPRARALALAALIAALPVLHRAVAAPLGGDPPPGWWGDPLVEARGRFAFGSGRLLHALWSQGELEAAAPGDDGEGTALPGDLRPARRTPLAARPPLPPALGGSIRSVDGAGPPPLLALTFDLCQAGGRTSGFDAEVVEALRDLDVPATLYLGGLWMRAHPERTLQLIADPRFEVGNHGWSHADAAALGEGGFADEVLRTQVQYELAWEELYGRAARLGLEGEMSLVPRIPLTFRFPFGSCSPRQLVSLAAWGLPAVQWSLVPGDPDPSRTASDLARSLVGGARPGAVAVLHANGRGRHTAEAIRLAVPRLRRGGYRFVTVSQLLAAGRPRAEGLCYVLAPGDTGRYDGSGPTTSSPAQVAP